jgi:hypothetical protein
MICLKVATQSCDFIDKTLIVPNIQGVGDNGKAMAMMGT